MRDHLGLKPGAPVRFSYTAEGGVAILPAVGPDTFEKKTASRFEKLKGTNRKGWSAHGLKSTDEIMSWLRGYDEDKHDPGFTPRATNARRGK
jgi:bifunctional DNA-binding transcriptional regulator/antitoxin component of YhaV-PrlF toxin-antitoxin module